MTHANRVKAITESPLAKGREELAEHLACCHPTLSVAQAIEALSYAPIDLESRSLSMLKSMERVISQMALPAAAKAEALAKIKAKAEAPKVMSLADKVRLMHGLKPKGEPDADDGEVQPRMTLAERARQTFGKH